SSRSCPPGTTTWASPLRSRTTTNPTRDSRLRRWTHPCTVTRCPTRRCRSAVSVLGIGTSSVRVPREVWAIASPVGDGDRPGGSGVVTPVVATAADGSGWRVAGHRVFGRDRAATRRGVTDSPGRAVETISNVCSTLGCGLEQPGCPVAGAGGGAVGPHARCAEPRGPARRRRRPGVVAQAGALRAPAGRGARGARAVRRAALPLQLQLPRRREPPGGAGRAGGAAGPFRDRAHRPRRHVRGGPVRRGRRRAGRPHRLRRRALPRP